MAKEQVKITATHLLIVEGKDELGFFRAFNKHHKVSDVQIIPIGGKTQFKAQLNAVVNLSDFSNVTAIGIIRDADDSEKSAFDSICSALSVNNLAQPLEISSFIESEPAIGILIMPTNNEGTGRMLEDVCLAAVMDDPASSCVDDYFKCLSEAEITHKDKDIAKAYLHAFLASRKVPDLRLGEAAQKGYFDFNHAVFQPIKAFLETLSKL